VLTPTIEDGAVRRRAAWSCTTAKRTRWAARTAWTTWSFGVLPTICWRPSRTLAEATWTASAARRRRASLRGKDLTSRAVAPDLTLQRSQVRKRRDPCAIHARWRYASAVRSPLRRSGGRSRRPWSGRVLVRARSLQDAELRIDHLWQPSLPHPAGGPRRGRRRAPRACARTARR